MPLSVPSAEKNPVTKRCVLKGHVLPPPPWIYENVRKREVLRT